MPTEKHDEEHLLSPSERIYQEQVQLEHGEKPPLYGSLNSTRLVCIALFVSVLFNAILCFRSITRSCTYSEADSRFLGTNLVRNITFDKAMSSRGWTSTPNMTRNDELWRSIPISPGVVALDHSLTDSMALPRGDTFPWDDNKSVYILDFYHNLHCLKALYAHVTETERGQPHSMDYSHMVHCLDQVRRGVTCNAGNVIRSTEAPPSMIAPIASGHINQCVDVDAFEDWTRRNSACYHYTHMNDSSWSQIDRMKDCPPESPYLDKVKAHFQLGDDWKSKYGSWEDEM